MNQQQIAHMARQEVRYALDHLRTTGNLTSKHQPRKHQPDNDFVQEDEEGNKILSFYMGSLINPSGKYYMPFACSNVDACPRCKGNGCAYCGETGSREAYEDELFWEFMDKYAGKHGAYITAGEGDPTDTFICWSLDSAS